MRRAGLLVAVVLAGLLAALVPLPRARSEAPRLPRVGDLGDTSPAVAEPYVATFRGTLLPVTVPGNVLTINLKTARALGLTIPPAVLASADVALE